MTRLLRPACNLDASAAGGIMNSYAQTTPWLPVRHELNDLIGYCQTMIARGWVTVVDWGGEVAGFIARHHGFVHALYVSAAARGQGVGHQLLRNAQMQENSIDLWTFQANTAAHRFYRREGFHEIERTCGAGNDENLPDIRFQWKRGQL